jgi:hypothetical protein
VAYDPQPWHDAYVMLGSAAAALTGLVFVALSIHLRCRSTLGQLVPTAFSERVVITSPSALSTSRSSLRSS